MVIEHFFLDILYQVIGFIFKKNSTIMIHHVFLHTSYFYLRVGHLHHCALTSLFQSACKPADRKEQTLGHIQQLATEVGKWHDPIAHSCGLY